MIKPSLALILLNTLFILPASSQEEQKGLTGSITNKSDIDVYTVTAICNTDTLRATYAEQQFSLPISNVGSYKITITAPGFNDFSTVVNYAGSPVDIGQVSMSKQKQVNLGEVVVKGKRVVVKRDGSTYEISNIAGTYLGDAGSIMDMLQWTPGLRRDGSDGVQTINGKSPEIYIDGRKINSMDELKMRPSSEVSKIEVIRNPGARYSSSTQAVINITMRKHIKDYVGVRLVDEARYGRRLSDDFDFNLETKTGKISTFWAWHFETTHNKANALYSTEMKATDNFASLSDMMDQHWKTDKNGHYLIGGITYSFTPKSAISLQYNCSFVGSKMYQETLHHIVDAGVESISNETENDPKDRRTRQCINLGYDLRGDNSQLNLNASYVSIDNKGKKNIAVAKQTGDIFSSPDVTDINSKSDYDLYNFEGNYSLTLAKVNKFGAGVASSYIKNYSDYNIASTPQNSRRKDFVQAAYMTYRRNFSKLSLNAQLRYEYTYTSLTNYGKEQKQTFGNLLPYFLLKYDINDDNQLELGYRRSPSRPNISQLNNIVTYSDLFHSQTGNPALETEVNNNIWVDYIYKDFDASITLRKHDKEIVMGTFTQKDTRRILSKPVNVRYAYDVEFSLSYDLSGTNYSLSLMADEAYTYKKYRVIDGLVNKSQHLWHTEFYIDASYKFYKTIEAYTSLKYLSPYLEGTTKTGDMWGVDVGVKGTFLNRKLVVSVEGNDLLHRSITPYWSSTYANVHEWRRNYFDTRYVTLKVQYRLNTIRSNYKNKTIGIEAENRAQ